MSKELIAVNNNKIRTVIKEMIYRSVLEMINIDNNNTLIVKEGLVIKDKLVTIVNLVVNNNIVDLMHYYQEHKEHELEGKIIYMLNSVFSAIDLDAVTLDEIDGKYATITKNLINTIATRLFNELDVYKNIYLPSMRIVSTRAKALMGELQHIDVDTLFNIVYAEEQYITEVMVERGYTDHMLGGISDYSILDQIFLKPLNNVDVYSTIKNTEYADLGMLISELDANGELGSYVEQINDLIKNEYGTALGILRFINNLGIESIPLLSIFIIFLKDYVKNTDAVLRTSLIAVYNKAITALKSLISNLNNLKTKNVLIYKTIKTGDAYTLYIIKENFSRLFKEHEDINMSDIYGFGVLVLSESELNTFKLCTIDKLVENRNVYNDTYNKYIDIITSTNRLNNINEIRNIYSIVVRDVNINLFDQSSVDGKNDLMNRTVKIVNGLSLSVLLDPRKTTEIIFSEISEGVNNFGLFNTELDNAKKIIGDDVDIDTAIIYASVVILSKYFVSMLKVM